MTDDQWVDFKIALIISRLGGINWQLVIGNWQLISYLCAFKFSCK